MRICPQMVCTYTDIISPPPKSKMKLFLSGSENGRYCGNSLKILIEILYANFDYASI